MPTPPRPCATPLRSSHKSALLKLNSKITSVADAAPRRGNEGKAEEGLALPSPQVFRDNIKNWTSFTCLLHSIWCIWDVLIFCLDTVIFFNFT